MHDDTGNLSHGSSRGAILAVIAAIMALLLLSGGHCEMPVSVASTTKHSAADQHPEASYGTPSDDVVSLDGFSLASYGPASTAWTLYLIDDARVNGGHPRQAFREALDVPAEFRPRLRYYDDWNADHGNDPIDKGHWFSAKDAAFSAASQRACFEARNLSPQAKALNEGPWRQLEDQIRGLWKPGTRIFVCCGPLWAPIGEEPSYEVRMVGAIPMAPQHYKTILIDDGRSQKTKAWIFPNRNDDLPTPEEAEVCVDYLEQKARLDFWRALPDELEAKLEATK